VRALEEIEMSSIAEIFLGAILSIITTIVIEFQRKPKLIIQIARPSDNRYPNHPAARAKFLGVDIENKPLPLVFRWLSRNTATQCFAFLTFYHLDGQKVFSSAMVGRWSGSPEPVAPIAISGDNITISNVTISFDFSAASVLKRDIFPGNLERLDVVARFDNDSECYGWNNEAYFSNPQWRNPKWQLKPDRYIVKVEVETSGEKMVELFRLCNDVSLDDFRLEPAQKQDYAVLNNS
jgi:hypothetical protein